MRIGVVLDCERDIDLPVQYNHIVQGFLYNNLPDSSYREFMHQDGYAVGKRRFKLFTYSRLLGEYSLGAQGSITFRPPVKLVVSSPLENFIEELTESLNKQRSVFLGRNSMEVKSVYTLNSQLFNERVAIRMLSPMVAYTTSLQNGRKKTHYYSPWSEKFQDLVRRNLLQKYYILHNTKLEDDDLQVMPQEQRESDCTKILNFKGTVIKAYSGRYVLQGNPELIKVAYETGLGSKNSQGFGCWEPVHKAS